MFFFSSRRRHTRCYRDWSSDVCSSDLVRGRRLWKLYPVEFCTAVEAPEQERQRLTEMSERELHPGEAVEHPADHEAQGVGAGLERPLPHRALQQPVAGQDGMGRDRVGGMKIDQRAERLRALPE